MELKIKLDEDTTNDAFATLETQNGKFHAALVGPMDVVKTRFESPTGPYFDVHILPARGVSATRDAALAAQLVRVLEEVVDVKHYARKQITVTVQIVDCVPHLWDVQLVDIANCVFLACVRGGIRLQSSFWAACIYLDPRGSPVDGSARCVGSAHRVIYSVKNAVVDQLILLDSNGEFDREHVWTVLDEAKRRVESEMAVVRARVSTQVASSFIFQ